MSIHKCNSCSFLFTIRVDIILEILLIKLKEYHAIL